MPNTRYDGKWQEGWHLCLTLTTIAIIASFSIWAMEPNVAGIRGVAIFSARLGLVLFCLAFVAQAAHTLLPSSGTQWLERNRRYIGVTFAAVHTVHLCAVIIFAIEAPALFETAKPPFIFSVLGALGYLVMYSMAATSIGRADRWLSKPAWRYMHKTGSYYIWAMFLSAFAIYTLHRSTVELHVALCAGLLIAVIGLRGIARIKQWQLDAQRTPFR